MLKATIFIVLATTVLAFAIVANREINYAFRGDADCSLLAERNLLQERSCRFRREALVKLLARPRSSEDQLRRAGIRRHLSIRYWLAGNTVNAKGELLTSIILVARAGKVERASKMMSMYEMFLSPDCTGVLEDEILMLCGRARRHAGEIAYLTGDIDEARRLYAIGVELTRRASDYRAAVFSSGQVYLELFVGNSCYAEKLAKKSKKWLLEHADTEAARFYGVGEEIDLVTSYLATASEQCAARQRGNAEQK